MHLQSYSLRLLYVPHPPHATLKFTGSSLVKLPR